MVDAWSMLQGTTQWFKRNAWSHEEVSWFVIIGSSLMQSGSANWLPAPAPPFQTPNLRSVGTLRLRPDCRAFAVSLSRYDVLVCGFRINWRRPPVQFYAERLGVQCAAIEDVERGWKQRGMVDVGRCLQRRRFLRSKTF